MMHLILALVFGLLGAMSLNGGGLLFGVLIGVLGGEVWSLRRRLAQLEQRRAAEADSVEATEFEVEFEPQAPPETTPFPEPPPASKPAARGESAAAASALDRFFAGIGERTSALGQGLVGFFTGGNLVLKIGVIVLFFGVAFLLKYAAQRNMIPIEFRLAGVACSGLALLGVGWWLRRARLGYGLILQGGGVGILYLVVFAAAKLYGFLPTGLSLVVMIGLVLLSGMLAVLQESRGLAFSGIVGGFLAPVLMAEGGGSHVQLFAYYALLNCGILGIAWFKSWRELNLAGFLFTFAIGTFWGGTSYQPAFFASTEPFLILFFLFYVLISVLFAHRQPVELRGFIDGPLVFGLPLVVSGLQYGLVRDMEYGMALSALALGLFYLSLASLLWRRMVFSMHLLCEAFLALGVVFGSLAIPLALDGRWSATIWALEGAGMVWVGARQNRVVARHFGLLLQMGAAAIFLDSVRYPAVGLPFANQFFLGCSLLALAALFSGFILDRFAASLRRWEVYFALPLLVAGLCWWYIGGAQEMAHRLVYPAAPTGFLLFCSFSSIIFGVLARMLPWPRLGLALHLHLAAMLLLTAVVLVDSRPGFHLLQGWGAVAWPAALVVQYLILWQASDLWPQRLAAGHHLLSLWLLVFVLAHEAAWAVDRLAAPVETWPLVCWVLVPSGALMLLMQLGRGAAWPVGHHRDLYLGPGGLVPALGLVLWLVLTCGATGDPFPLPYLPLVNPVELSGLFALATLARWGLYRRKEGIALRYLPEQPCWWGLAAVGFLFINSVVARAVHFFAAVPYYPEPLFRSVVFQAALAALWGSGALAITVWATRRGSRVLWGAGAILLGMVVVKLFLVDLSGTGTVARIVSFLVVGVLMLIIGYFSPIPPKKEVESP